jgi:hypothetical protein
MHSYITTHFPVLVKDTSIEIAGVKLVFWAQTSFDLTYFDKVIFELIYLL